MDFVASRTLFCILFSMLLSQTQVLHAQIQAQKTSKKLDLLVATSYGKVKGVQEKDVLTWRGLPYARPPVGELRFQSPLPPKPWQGIRTAEAFSPECHQMRIEGWMPWLHGEEDCLYLNIYRPENAIGKLPVLVWIHGGGRRTGNSRRDVSDFVRQTNTMVVTIGYRLGHMAMMAHPDLSSSDPTRPASGNYGIEDAIQALRWLQDEIQHFGGDRNRVSIGGMSGGGTMVCALLQAKKADGLFHSAIIQSAGGCWFETQLLAEQEVEGERMARWMLCLGNDKADCLRSRPAWAFYLTGGAGVSSPYKLFSTSYYTSLPIGGGMTGHVVDNYLYTESWPKNFQRGDFNHVPVMISTTSHEGRWIYGKLLLDIANFEMDESDYREALLGVIKNEAIVRNIERDFPLGKDKRTPMEQYSDIVSEAHYTCTHSEMAAAMSRFTPTWHYEFKVPGTQIDQRIELGAYHGVDTEYLFGDGFRGPVPAMSKRQQAFAMKYRQYIANFVHNSNPNGKGLPKWQPASGWHQAPYMAMDYQPRQHRGLREKACTYWREKNRWQKLPSLIDPSASSTK